MEKGVPLQLPSGRAQGYLKHDKVILRSELQGVSLKSPPLNFSKCQIVENMAES